MAENGEGAAAAAAARSTPLESGHADMVHDCQLDYYGTRLATCSSDRLVKVFQVSGTPQAPTHQHLADLAGHEHPVWRVAWAHPKVRTPGGAESTRGAQSAQIGGISRGDATRRGGEGRNDLEAGRWFAGGRACVLGGCARGAATCAPPLCARLSVGAHWGDLGGAACELQCGGRARALGLPLPPAQPRTVRAPS